jgi:hypothetical protein
MFSVVDRGGSGGKVADIWNVATGQATPVPHTDISSVYSLDYAASGLDGLIADSYQNGTLGLAAIATGLPNAMLLVNPAAGTELYLEQPVFSPDSRIVAVSDDSGMIYLVNVPGKRLAVALTAEKMYNAKPGPNAFSGPGDIDSITFSPDSMRVACDLRFTAVYTDFTSRLRAPQRPGTPLAHLPRRRPDLALRSRGRVLR